MPRWKVFLVMWKPTLRWVSWGTNGLQDKSAPAIPPFFPGLCNWVACLLLFGGTERAQSWGQDAWVSIPTLQLQRRLEWHTQQLSCLTPQREKLRPGGMWLLTHGVPVHPRTARNPSPVPFPCGTSNSSYLGKALLTLLTLGFPLCTRKSWNQIIYKFLSVSMVSGSVAVFLFLAILVGIHLLDELCRAPVPDTWFPECSERNEDFIM